MNGVSKTSEASISPDPVALGWRIVAVGDFNRDGSPDLVWQMDGLDYAAVWLMNGATWTGLSPWLPQTGDPNWRIVAVGDFGSVVNGNPDTTLDGNVDVVWQHDVTGQKAMWFMGQAPTANAQIPLLWAGLIEGATADPTWQIVGAGDFGNGLSGDGISLDLVLQNYQTRESAIWWMNQKRISAGDLIRNVTNPEQSWMVDDEDWRICAVARFDGSGSSDIFWRYTPIAYNAVWFMDAQYIQTSAEATHLKDPAWRFGRQTIQDTTWRQQAFTPTISATASSSSITLAFNIPASGTEGQSIERRQPPGTQWTSLVNGYTSSTYPDSPTQTDTLYEYRIFRENVYSLPKYKIQSGYNVGPIDYRGRVVLVIDETVKSGIAGSLATYTNNLIGDGWYVTLMDAPRHKENWADNLTPIDNIRTALAAAYRDTTYPATCAVLIGHVPIPYSGYTARDGHSDHQGAWPADMYYADIDGSWTDTGAGSTTPNLINNTYPENSNVVGDGKWDNDFAPSPVELAIGRIDFARLPAFGALVGDVPTSAEIGLLNQYFSKNDKYRRKLAPYPLNPKAIAGGTLLQSFPNAYPTYRYIDGSGYIYDEAARNCSALFGNVLQTLVIGDPYEQKSESFLVGIAEGKGGPDAINTEALFSRHDSSDLASGTIEAPIAFYIEAGSYFGDWNMVNDFMRATIATPNYGLAVMFDLASTRWRVESLAMGDYLGNNWRSMVNDPDYMDTPLPTDNNYKYRELAIMGDPTLRLHTMKRPSLTKTVVSSTRADLNWTQDASDGAEEFRVYRASTVVGPYSLLAVVNGSTFTYVDEDPTGPPAASRAYNVRAIKTVTSGSGSYKNNSEGQVVQ